jgi:hypothetical protein
MGNSSGIKWNGVTQAQTQDTIETIGSDVQIILRDPRTEQEWVTSSVDYISALTKLGVISSGNNWDASGNDIFNNNSGNVGIGTATPGYTLDVSGKFYQTFDNGSGTVADALFASNIGFSVIDATTTSRQHITADSVIFDVFSNDETTFNHTLEISPTIAKLSYTDTTEILRSEVLLTNGMSEFNTVGANGATNLKLIGDTDSTLTTSFNFIINNGISTMVGVGTGSPTSKLTVDGDIEVFGSANGLILESPDGTRYRVTVANGGTLTVGAV